MQGQLNDENEEIPVAGCSQNYDEEEKVLRPFQADLHQQLPWQLDSFSIQTKESWMSLLGSCFNHLILTRKCLGKRTILLL
ncbi:uncharacterized protein LOC115695662 isoform X5 [Cannabis sativa]|uniref:uncharacterized protein LOC115695662 isoform X5 n=1 Tax=Cannabis sativa TaxID=3483 RepID=UPI0029CA13B6|nr:uncharacterized protein LOC115695662 isoform X5 [Cannabis sativa]